MSAAVLATHPRPSFVKHRHGESAKRVARQKKERGGACLFAARYARFAKSFLSMIFSENRFPLFGIMLQ
jgi:hypothetical protein